MNTKQTVREQISALADSELADTQVTAVLVALHDDAVRADWETYHCIGDVLRSDDMSIAMSSDFSARMAALLEAEPVILAPAALHVAASTTMIAGSRQSRRWAMPGMAVAAAVAAVAFIATPHLMVAFKTEPSDAVNTAAVAVSDSQQADANVVLRDPRIDDYMLAHQRFSPSLYSTAQYARSATFANDSNK